MSDPVQRYQAAVEALNRSDWAQAQGLARDLLQDAPQHAGVHFVLGVASLQRLQMPVALEHLRAAVLINGKRPDYLAQFARALATARLFREALVAADRATSLSPSDPLTLDTLGVVYTQANQHEKALAAFRGAVQQVPGHASYRFNLATSLTFSGDIAGAESEYEACLRLDPGYWKAHLALSQLRRVDAAHNHIPRLQALLDQGPGHPEAPLYLHLSLAKEFEDMGRHPEAFRHFTAGKAAGGRGRGYSSARDEALFEAIMASFPVPVPATGGIDSEEPIFVIGMPRSGTTLVERILSSHPQVLSCGELQNFSVALKRTSGSTTPRVLDVDSIVRARDVDPAQLGREYLASTRPVTGGRPRFVDKLPHNFLYAGHIARALPKARIICLRRHPLDTCLGNFRQLFALSSPFYDYSFDLMDTGRYYLMFERLMRHWQQVLPGRILELHYESLVDDQAGQTRRLLEFCGLPWDDACLSFEHNEAPVATASTVQVREPLHRGALQRWKRYETELAGLRELLEAGGAAL